MVTVDRPQVNIRLERELLDELDEMAAAESLDRAEFARRLLREGLKRERVDLAVRRYRHGEVSAARAAEMAHISLYEILDRIHEEGVPYEPGPAVFRRIDAMAASRQPTAVREESQPHQTAPWDDAENWIDDLRQQFRPERTRWLFVGESSPAGGTHFYRANSNLFRATQAAFAQALGTGVPSGPAFLHFFRERGAWLVDLIDRPTNVLPSLSRKEVVDAGIQRLTRVIAEIRPERIFIVKVSIAGPVRQAATLAGFDGGLVQLPFPLRQWRSAFIRDLSAALREPAHDDL